MTRTLAARTTPFALAVALTLGLLGATSALADHQYRVSAAAVPTVVTQGQVDGGRDLLRAEA